MNKIISFSLWGNNPKYCVGAIRNAQLAKEYFPEWICHFYYDNSVPRIYIKALEAFDNTKLMETDSSVFGAFWRFRSMVKDTIVLSRDTDSRLSQREKQIVDDWLISSNKLCTIRDHANHYEFPILAGMWGIKDGLTQQDMDDIHLYNRPVYLMDQFYLRDKIWPKYYDRSVVYGLKETIWMRESYTSVGRDFIGQTYDENENTIYDPKI
jgi:hypothetical protein